MSGDKQNAPLPRDQDVASFSEMVPFRSKKIKLWKSPIFWFVAFTAVLTVALFAQLEATNSNDVQQRTAAYFLILTASLFYMMALALLAVHAYSKSDKPITFYIFPCLLVYFFMLSPLWNLIYVPFDMLAGGDVQKTDELPVAIWRMFSGPGLREELTKGLPTLICAAMTVWPARFKFLPTWIYNLLRVRSPLDGILMGFAAGSAFLFFETSVDYVPSFFSAFLKNSHGNDMGAFGAALGLLLPRAMDGWIGHMAWSGTFGYFIGLAVIRPHLRWQLLAGGWAVTAALHGLWDSVSGNFLLLAVGGASGVLAIACLVKARQLDASLFGRSNETFGSIVVGAPNRPAPAAAPGISAPPPQTPSPTPVAATPAAQTAPHSELALTIGALRLPLRSGVVYDLDAEPLLAGKAQGLRVEVTQHPTHPNVMGLKNLGANTWYARLRDNTLQPVESQRSLRLAAGGSIDFGNGVVGQIVQS